MTIKHVKIKLNPTPRRWTASEDEVLVREYRAGKRMHEIGEMLGRTVKQVGSRCQRLRAVGVDLPFRVGRTIDIVRLNMIGNDTD